MRAVLSRGFLTGSEKKSESGVNTVKIFLLFFTSIFLFVGFPEASYENRRKLRESALTESESFSLVESLLKDGGVLTRFEIRRLLDSLPYEELERINTATTKNEKYPRLNVLSENIIETKSLEVNIFEFTADVTPLKPAAPFTGNHRGKFRISELRPFAERVYFSNPEFEYIPRNIQQVNCSHWLNPGYPGSDLSLPPAPAKPPSGEPQNFEPRFLWSLNLPGAKRFNSIMSHARQPIMLDYEDRPVSVVVENSKVFYRRAGRIFCYDISTGRRLWIFPSSRGKTSEHYHTYRHPHQPSSQAGFLLSGDRIYAELEGKLLALRVKENGYPEVLWEKSLGEFYLCSNPVKAGDVIIATLINPRGKMWACGYESESGKLLWSRFIGLSSYAYPSSVLYSKTPERVFLGTNHGAALSLIPETGEIVWIRKYEGKSYDLYEHWFSGKFNLMLRNQAITSYDTGFMELGFDGTLYCKPRESDYVYLLEPVTGELIEKFLIDSSRYSVLRARDSLMYFLATDPASGDRSLKIVDIYAEETVFEKEVGPGHLRGVYFEGPFEMLFKAGSKLYRLTEDKSGRSLTSTDVFSENWLIDVYGKNILLAGARELECISLAPGETPGEHPMLSVRDSILDKFGDLAAGSPSRREVTRLLREITRNSELFNGGDFYDIIKKDPEVFLSPLWSDFIQKINKFYGDYVISRDNIDLRFSGYLKGKGLYAPTPFRKRAPRESSGQGDFSARVQYTNLLRHRDVTGSEELPDFFFLLHYDQVLCLNESGDILWDVMISHQPWLLHQRVFSPSVPQKKLRRKRFGNIKPEIFIYRDTAVISEGLNLIAVDLNDGSYKWSITSDTDIVNEFRTWRRESSDELLEFNVDRDYLSRVHLFADFLGDDLIVTQRNIIYKIDPETGYARATRKLDGMDELTFMQVQDGKIYVYSLKSGSFYEIDNDLNVVSEIPVNPDETFGPNADPNIYFSGDYYIFQFPEKFLVSSANKPEAREVPLEKAGYNHAKIVADCSGITVLNENGFKRFSLNEKNASFEPEIIFYDENMIRCLTYFSKNGNIVIPRITENSFVFEIHSCDSEHKVDTVAVLKFDKISEFKSEKPAIDIPYMFFLGQADNFLFYLIVYSRHNTNEKIVAFNRNVATIFAGINLDTENYEIDFFHEFPKQSRSYIKVYQGDLTYGLRQFIETRNYIIYSFSGKNIYGIEKTVK